LFNDTVLVIPIPNKAIPIPNKALKEYTTLV